MDDTVIIGGEEWPVISRYTRAQALDDGVLVDVTDTAREAGFKVPVAVTAAVWALVEPTDAEAAVDGQDAAGRLWDLLWVASWAARRIEGDPGSNEVRYGVLFRLRGRPGVRAGMHKQELKIHSGGGDDGEHVLTIMLPHED